MRPHKIQVCLNYSVCVYVKLFVMLLNGIFAFYINNNDEEENLQINILHFSHCFSLLSCFSFPFFLHSHLITWYESFDPLSVFFFFSNSNFSFLPFYFLCKYSKKNEKSFWWFFEFWNYFRQNVIVSLRKTIYAPLPYQQIVQFNPRVTIYSSVVFFGQCTTLLNSLPLSSWGGEVAREEGAREQRVHSWILESIPF